jgi:hypothetical protein
MAHRTLQRWQRQPHPPTSRQVARFLRRCLASGIRIELDGLGAFQKMPTGEYHFEPFTQPRVFIAYVEEDIDAASRLCEHLRAQGCNPWLDREKLLPGQNWPRSIERAIDMADYFVAVFSTRSVIKRGQFQSELRYALDCASRQPLDRSFLLPVRLETCEVPNRISRATQYVDLFPDWDAGVRRLIDTIHQRA